MNYLDLLPDDVMKIINRKVHDLQIKQRKIERKRNKEIAEDNKLKADRRRMIFYKYAGLYHKYVFISEEKKRKEYLDKLYDKVLLAFGRTLIRADFYPLSDEPHLIITYILDDIIYGAKVY